MAIINGTALANILNGTAADDTINGLAGNDTLNGLGGNDTLDGGLGNDTMAGGIGNDTYIVDSASDIVTEAAASGTDTVRSTVSYTLGLNVENLVLLGTAAINGTGNTLANVITGNGANNILNGGAGNDTLIGGLGNDTYVVDSVSDIVTEAASAGTDLVQSSVTLAALALNVENLTLTGAAAINGTGNTLNNVITGNTANNVLNGGSGDDTLNGGLGNDTMVGGLGNDTFVVNVATDVVTEAAAQGTDTIQSAVTIAALAANVENLTLTGATAINGTGNTLDNVITGNSANNVLNGGAAGNDTLNGGAGNDTMVGGIGNDTYVVDAAGDIVTEAAGAGTDTIQSSVTIATLALNVENLTLTGAGNINGTGNTLANVITGNGGANILNGGAGVDTLIGGLGNDTYIVDSAAEIVTEAASAGTDTVQAGFTYSLLSQPGLANVENLTLTGTAAMDGAGNTLGNVITGNTGDNVLDGRTGNDTLNGLAGHDILIGGAGADTLNGAEGHDSLLGGADNDTLSGGADNDLLAGETGNDTLNGGAGFDTLLGHSGNDVLDGGADADILIGYDGDDTLIWDAADLIIQGGTGVDTLKLAGADETIDLVATPNGRIQGIEIIDLTGTGNNTLNFELSDVVPLSFFPTLRVDGNEGDSISTNEHWTHEGTTEIGDLTYHVVTNNGVTLNVQEGVDFISPNAAPTGDSAFLENGTEDENYLIDSTILLDGFTDTDGDAFSVSDISADHGMLEDNGDGTWTFTPDENYSGPVNLDFVVEDVFGAQTNSSTSFELDPVADAPTLNASDATGTEDSEIPLPINASLNDLDGSETLSIVISGVPDGALLSAGTDNGGGNWTLTPEQLDELSITPPADIESAFDLTVTATSTDGTDTESTVQVIHVTVVPEEEEAAVTEGTAVDGYIVGATVFADTNENGTLDAGEAWTTTGGSGQFSLVGGSGPLVLFGGTDISTNLAFEGTLRAPEGATVITPLTTLIAELVSSGAAPDAATAEGQLETALGLSGVDLTTFDPVAAALDGDAGNDATALSVFAAGVQVQNAIVLAASLISGTGEATFEDAAAAVITALADTIDSAGTIDLANAADMESLVGSAATEAGADIGTTADEAGAIIAAANTVVDDAIATAADNLDALTGVAQVAIVAQDTDTGAAAALTEAGDTGDATSAQTDFTGANFDTAVDDAADDVGAVGGAVAGTNGNDTLNGTAGNDVLDGLGGSDTLSAGNGNDILVGGAGRDNLDAGDGDDQLFGGAGDDFLTGGSGNDLLNGGENAANQLHDIDTANYEINDGIGGAMGVTVNLATGTANDGIGGTDTLANIEKVIGTNFNDVLTGGDPSNLGTNRSEQFEGRGGNDTITGSGNPDGSMLALYGRAADSVFVNLGPDDVTHEGTLIEAGTAIDGDGGVDTLVNVNRITGSVHNDAFYGSDTTIGSERFQGMAGDDYMDGKGGIDYLQYQNSIGAVTFTFSNTTFGSGTASDGYGFTDTFVNIEGVRGSNFNDVLIGSDRNEGFPNGGSVERFEGMAGNDVIAGNGGADRIEFGQSPTGVIVNLSFSTVGVGQVIIGPNQAFDGFGGVDTLSGIEQVTGSRFNDTFIGPNGTGGNRFDGGLGVDTVSYQVGATGNVTVDLNPLGGDSGGGNVSQNTGGAGFDTLANIENLTGSSFNDTLRGDNGANRLNGRGGNDMLTGRGGNDILDGGENSNNVFADSDTVDYSSEDGSGGVTVNLGTGTATDSFGDTDTLISIERVFGTSEVDFLTGGDTLNIGTGISEQFEGKAGDDVITGGDTADGFTTWSLYNSAPAGVRVNIGTTDVDLGVEGILLAGTAWDGYEDMDTLVNINRVRGSAHDDQFYGGDTTPNGVERFEGMAGDDFINGGAGIDILHYQSGTTHGVTVTLSAAGSGTVLDDGFGDTDIFINIEGVRGTNFDDVLTGSDRNDGVIERFEGMGGNDTITGNLGLDRVEYGQSGIGVNVNLATGFASDGFGTTDTLSGIEQVTGSRFNDTITGNGEANLLNGSGGNDTLIGGAGNDVLNGGENLESRLADTDAVNYNASGVVNGVNVNLGTGIASDDGFGSTDMLFNIERVFGTNFDDVLTGGDTANINTGKSEQFEGREGNDVITGGDIDLGFTTFAMYTNDPNGIMVNLDTVAHVMGDPGDTVSVAAGTAFDGFGDVDTLAEINRIRGSAHNDFMWGGNPTGGTANERFEGMAGNDWINGGDGFDYVMYQSGNQSGGVTLTFDINGDGTASDGFGTTDSFFSIEGVRGSSFNDVLTGSDRNDVTERFEGMAGNDTITGNDGQDRVEFGQSENGINVNLALGTALDGWGAVDTLSGIEQVTGSRVNDTITGSSGDNRLDGSDGNDRIAGGGGDDTLIGGADVDTFDWNAGDQGIGGDPAVDTITDFNMGAGDRLDLRDLLVGENGSNLDQYLDFSLVGGDTIINVRSTGLSGDMDQVIVLDGVDLTAGSTLSDATIINNLLSGGSLLADGVV